MENSKNEIIGIYFSKDYKRFKEGTFIPLSSNYSGYYDKSKYALIIEKNINETQYISTIKNLFKFDFEIDIKGIIGNNGSGKSTILKLLVAFLKEKIVESENLIYLKDKGFFGYSINDVYDTGAHLITNYNLIKVNRKTQNSVELFHILNSSHEDAIGYKSENKIETAIRNEQDSNFLIDEVLKKTLGFNDNEIHKNIKIKTHGGSRKNQDKENILSIVKSITKYLLGNKYKPKKYDNNKIHFYIFNKIKSERFNSNDELFRIFMIFYWYFYLSWMLSLKKDVFKNYLSEDLFEFNILDKLLKEINSIVKGKHFLNVNKKYQYIYDLISITSSNKIKNNFLTSEYKDTDSLAKIIKNNNLDYKLSIEVFEYISNQYNIDIIKGGDEGKYYMYFEFEYENFINDALENNLEEDLILSNYIIGLNIKLKDKNGNTFLVENFSNGEKQMIKIFLQLKHLYEKIEENKNKNIFIILDEPDESLHLEWQRKFLYFLLNGIKNIFKDYKGKINICFATHSPFIISDLSKEHILFLEREKTGNESLYNAHSTIKTFDEVKSESNITIDNTFLGNIPELIKGGFFLESQYGYLGETLIENIIKNNDLKNLFVVKGMAGDKFIFEYLMLKNINK